MRRLLSWLAGWVIVALLGGTGSAVVAQDDDAELNPLGLSPVTGDIRYVRPWDGPIESEDADRSRRRSLLVEDIIELDDPRLSGAMFAMWNYDALPDPSGVQMGAGGTLWSGTAAIVNDDGSWRGTMNGHSDPDTQHTFVEYDLVGSGAYEGYSAVLHATGLGQRLDVAGWVFPGGWPEQPDPVEVPAE